MGIVACDTCNKTDPPTYNKAQVVFQFPKGVLAKASAGDVEDTIGQLLSISGDDQKAQGGQDPQSAQQGGQDQQPAAAQAAPAAAPQAEPQSIEKGMTPDQVEAVLGKPERKVNLGVKQLYVYKDMKVTFLNGQVSDVE
jgi:pyruvate/2-oxoglutarate dehydrogenase complex dihydrolipoamide acyltransferase (E2) component